MSSIVGSYHLAKHNGGRGTLLRGVPGVAPGAWSSSTAALPA
jgi:alanine dehydrogenase